MNTWHEAFCLSELKHIWTCRLSAVGEILYLSVQCSPPPCTTLRSSEETSVETSPEWAVFILGGQFDSTAGGAGAAGGRACWGKISWVFTNHSTDTRRCVLQVSTRTTVSDTGQPQRPKIKNLTSLSGQTRLSLFIFWGFYMNISGGSEWTFSRFFLHTFILHRRHTCCDILTIHCIWLTSASHTEANRGTREQSRPNEWMHFFTKIHVQKQTCFLHFLVHFNARYHERCICSCFFLGQQKSFGNSKGRLCVLRQQLAACLISLVALSGLIKWLWR